MNIVLEGPKGTGKSTIAKHFINKGYKYIHSSDKTDNDFKYQMKLLRGDKIVLDRFSLSEIIYSIIYSRESKLNDDQFFETFNDRNTIYCILFSSDDDLLVNRIKNRNEDKDKNINFKHVLLSNELFISANEFFEDLDLKTLVFYFDVSQLSSEDIIEFLEKEIN